MALVTCPECKKEMSSDADACPNCGKKQRRTGCLTQIIAVCMGLFMFSCAIAMFKHPPAGTNSTPVQEEALVLMPGWKFAREDYHSTITGTVQNKSNRSYSYVSIQFNLYDENGAQVGSTMANVNNLEPHGKWKFKALVLENTAESVKLKDLSGY